MKGKGDKGGGSSNSKFIDESCPLSFPALKPVDHIKTCPRFTSIIGRDPDVNDGADCVGMEEVDALQMELESLSASVVKRMRVLQEELQIVNQSMGLPSTPSSSHDKGKGDRLFSSAAPSSSSSHTANSSAPAESSNSAGQKRSSGKGKTSYTPSSGSDDRPPAKRMRTDSGRATYAQPMASSGSGSVVSSKGKGKFQQTKMSTSSVDTDSADRSDGASASLGARQSRNMTPSRFWAMVEPYCTPITAEDVRFLEDQLKLCEDIGEYIKVPVLGRHYAEKWAEEDLEQEQKDGNKTNDRRKGSVASGTNGISNGLSSSVDVKREQDGENKDDTSLFGPLTQRLIQGLLEENIISSLDDSAMIISDSDAITAATISSKGLAKQLHLGNTSVLERRIKRELEDIGILGFDDSDDENSVDKKDGVVGGDNGKGGGGDDEILSELRKKQAELKVLSQQNSSVLRLLLKQAKEEISRQELRDKMAAADNEVMEAYRRVQAAKSKKKTPTKKEKEAFLKSLRDREVICKQLLKSEPS